MEVKVLGIGAAGNKAVATAIEDKCITQKAAKMINTTMRDIPKEYAALAETVFSGVGGCGKEPKVGERSMVNAINKGNFDCGTIIDQDTKIVVLVTSTEGGTGSGATPVLAKAFEQLGMPVHVFAFIGFYDDIKGVANTKRFFKSLGNCSNVILHTICNEKFLGKDLTSDHRSAEIAANHEFAKQLLILIGSTRTSSDQNIDESDLAKLRTTPGYMDIKHISLTDVKNRQQFDKAIETAFTEGTCFDYEPSCKRLGILINASNSVLAAIDDSYSMIKKYTGVPAELFPQIQHDAESGDYIDLLVCGLQYPAVELLNVSKIYSEMKSKVNLKAPSLLDIFGDDDEDDLEIPTITNSSTKVTMTTKDDDDEY